MTVLHLPVPPAAEDQPEWYRVLVQVAAGQFIEPTTIRAAAIAATTHHDLQAAELARLGTYLTDASSAALDVCAELAEWRTGCEVRP